ncbi:carboxypeptidase-like regulatory domain-containing protein [Algibacter sp. R77976]|uniref:carboxypeptidase-like regulatory domain-containing protein n=1 Tax=Algibacter sp. R77976 TaxID=3093873 RepID=UPI0037C9E63E
MEQKINLTITKPCTEKFNQFNKTEKGGFCNSCKKEVIDFRNMTDKQLSSYFKSKTGKACGYFDTSQLTRDIQVQEFQQPKRLQFLKVAALAFLSLTSLHHVQAQEHQPKTEIIESFENKTQANKALEQDKLLTGTVVEESGPLPGANIILEGTTIGTSTNFDGEFIFPKTLKEGDVLVISYLGFTTQKIKIKKEQTQLNAVLNINMEYDTSCILMGEVDVNTVYETKRTFWQKIKGIF